MNLYKVKDIVEVLIEFQQVGIDGYCGFEFIRAGNLIITLKDHEPDWTDPDGYGEAVEEVELLESAGEY